MPYSQRIVIHTAELWLFEEWLLKILQRSNFSAFADPTYYRPLVGKKMREACCIPFFMPSFEQRTNVVLVATVTWLVIYTIL